MQLLYKKTILVFFGLFFLFSLASVSFCVAPAPTANLEVYLAGTTDSVSGESIPFGVTVDLVCTCNGFNGEAFSYLHVYRTTVDSPEEEDWILEVTLVDRSHIRAGETIKVPYVLENVGDYRFVWYVEHSKPHTATCSVVIGPVVSEPATIVAMGLSLISVCAVLLYKKEKR